MKPARAEPGATRRNRRNPAPLKTCKPEASRALLTAGTLAGYLVARSGQKPATRPRIKKGKKLAKKAKNLLNLGIAKPG
jgi:hypothetical protein